MSRKKSPPCRSSTLKPKSWKINLHSQTSESFHCLEEILGSGPCVLALLRDHLEKHKCDDHLAESWIQDVCINPAIWINLAMCFQICFLYHLSFVLSGDFSDCLEQTGENSWPSAANSCKRCPDIQCWRHWYRMPSCQALSCFECPVASRLRPEPFNRCMFKLRKVGPKIWKIRAA